MSLINDEAQMTNDEGMSKHEWRNAESQYVGIGSRRSMPDPPAGFDICHFVINSAFVIRIPRFGDDSLQLWREYLQPAAREPISIARANG